jgi:hypothetical protein
MRKIVRRLSRLCAFQAAQQRASVNRCKRTAGIPTVSRSSRDMDKSGGDHRRRRVAAMASLKVNSDLAYHAAVLGRMGLADPVRLSAQIATRDQKPQFWQALPVMHVAVGNRPELPKMRDEIGHLPRREILEIGRCLGVAEAVPRPRPRAGGPPSRAGTLVRTPSVPCGCTARPASCGTEEPATPPPPIGTIHRPVELPLDFGADESVLDKGSATLPTVKRESQMTKTIKRKSAPAAKAKVRSKPGRARAPAAVAAPRPGRKTAAAIELLRRPTGASTQEWLARPFDEGGNGRTEKARLRRRDDPGIARGSAGNRNS